MDLAEIAMRGVTHSMGHDLFQFGYSYLQLLLAARDPLDFAGMARMWACRGCESMRAKGVVNRGKGASASEPELQASRRRRGR